MKHASFTHLLLVSLLFTLIASCGQAPDIQSRRAQLDADFGDLTDEQTSLLIRDKAAAYVDAAEALAADFPTDTLAALPLYRAAEVARSLNEAPRAISIYRSLLEKYPSFPKVAEARFMLAFTYDESLNDLENARRMYEDFLEKHPTHGFADDAETLISHLGKSGEQILEELQRKAAEAMDSTVIEPI